VIGYWNAKLKSGTIMRNKRLVMNSFCAWDDETLVINILRKPSAKQNLIGKAKGPQLKN
jgi:hypothetical protein